ncbi:MAG: pyridoxamine 5'-phosphate oxidase family protein [Campylobacteraceae bacterium]|jgi:uncharacterized pyridoxamine 5'-phosphate oxidase family protein|nr:pyridoxamine 5'-phosphate oxidase family protein [Campylobacteraceae bacterium]
MVDYAAIFKENPLGVFATQDGEKVRSRLFQLLFCDGRKAYFCTSNEKPVYAQLRANPNAAFTTYPNDYSITLNVSGKVTFVDDRALKQKVLDDEPLIKSVYSSPDNPVFTLFYLDLEEIETYNIKDGARRYKL